MAAGWMADFDFNRIFERRMELSANRPSSVKPPALNLLFY
jgi:hypothetical protein